MTLLSLVLILFICMEGIWLFTLQRYHKQSRITDRLMKQRMRLIAFLHEQKITADSSAFRFFNMLFDVLIEIHSKEQYHLLISPGEVLSILNKSPEDDIEALSKPVLDEIRCLPEGELKQFYYESAFVLMEAGMKRFWIFIFRLIARAQMDKVKCLLFNPVPQQIAAMAKP
ncbi:MAG: hypothetical protein B0D92_01175 [Spirochaeta sp. LUC14_002_19_P3]|nr:MAG: hypothetical protein B0D92_01175 [Spirochaeta sp. LUC14_002_19_P3]